MGKTRLQTCTTELSELCEKLARKFSLARNPVNEESGETIFQGSTYNLTHQIDKDSEKISYKDGISVFSADSDKSLVYKIKGRYLGGRAPLLRRTILGIMVVSRLEDLADQKTTSKKELKECGLVVKLKYPDTKQVYSLIKDHIFDF